MSRSWRVTTIAVGISAVGAGCPAGGGKPPGGAQDDGLHPVGVAAGELGGDGAAERVADGDERSTRRIGQPDDIVHRARS